MVFNANFNNILAISWRSVLFVEETGENHRHVAKLVIGIDCTGCCKSNYHKITTTTTP